MIIVSFDLNSLGHVHLKENFMPNHEKKYRSITKKVNNWTFKI